MEPEWIEHDGSAVCPVPAGHDVELKYRNGDIRRTDEAQHLAYDWDHGCMDMPQHDITHYRDWSAWEQSKMTKADDVPEDVAVEYEDQAYVEGVRDLADMIRQARAVNWLAVAFVLDDCAAMIEKLARSVTLDPKAGEGA